MNEMVLTVTALESIKIEIDRIKTKYLPQAEEKVLIAIEKDMDIEDLVAERDFYKSRIPYLNDIVDNAKILATQDPYLVKLSIGELERKPSGEWYLGENKINSEQAIKILVDEVNTISQKYS
ncbi:hypothetical protein [Paenibacillus sp. 1A_MP2]|uniref:hypothetical protein n=1 Tax=Paenibacillus sp. 1A_MP2 TaxID=3457495 RepID=UPI003FCDD080